MLKRKRVVLSLKDKMAIIEALKNGETGRELATKYGVGTSTISDIKKNTDNILNFTCKLESEDKNKHRKSMKKPKNEQLEEALYYWFLQERFTGHPLSGPLLCEKALQLNKHLGGDETFHASKGWLCKFKTRHGIREFDTVQESKTEYSFKDDLIKELNGNWYDLDFVYNADETGLYWKLLPSKSPENVKDKERVTMLVCANATGTHKIPLLLIGNSKYQNCFKNVAVPLIYRSQIGAWINAEIFIDWYNNIFIPEVKKFQNEIGKTGNVLLLLDNSPTHPPAELLQRENGTFKTIFFPPNVTSLLQPMEQGVTERLKQLYRKQLLCRLAYSDDNKEDVLSLYEQINLKDCCYMIAEAWDLLERKTLIKSWNKILKYENDLTVAESDSILQDINELIKNIQICEGCEEDIIKDWLSCDGQDEGFNIMSDEEIIENVLQNKQQEIGDGAVENIDVKNEACPSNAEAFHALELAFKWFEKQPECNSVSLLQLKRIRDLAAIKRKNVPRNKKKYITSMKR